MQFAILQAHSLIQQTVKAKQVHEKKKFPAVSQAYVCCDLLIPIVQSFLVAICPNVVTVVTIFLLPFFSIPPHVLIHHLAFLLCKTLSDENTLDLRIKSTLSAFHCLSFHQSLSLSLFPLFMRCCCWSIMDESVLSAP